MYVCGWPFRPALILSPIEHFEIASLGNFAIITDDRRDRALEKCHAISDLQ
jgi:hypothetical protein